MSAPHGAAARAILDIPNVVILLADGTRLAARLWLPEGAEEDPVPAILEYLPYRKRDGTTLRDESTYPVFAAAGRVDDCVLKYAPYGQPSQHASLY